MNFDPRDDLYARLGLTAARPPVEAIKEARKAKLFDNHPDRGGTEEETKRINEASDILLAPESRASYDAERDAYWRERVNQYFAALRPKRPPKKPSPEDQLLAATIDLLVDVAMLGFVGAASAPPRRRGGRKREATPRGPRTEASAARRIRSRRTRTGE